jgi:hypothetical protein
MVLALKRDIERSNRRIEFVCFPETGVASVLGLSDIDRNPAAGVSKD